MKTRSQILRDLDIELGRQYRRQFLGETAEILIEKDTQWLCGRTERYFRVYLKKNKPNAMKDNGLVRATLVENHEDGMLGVSAC
jgi:tRNA A37 methylthiotransferase MiaB